MARRWFWMSMLSLALFITRQACAASDLTLTITADHARIEVEIEEELTGSRDNLRKWVTDAADTVSQFYGRFPTEALTLHLTARPGHGVQGGVTTNEDGARINVRVGTSVTANELTQD